MTPSMGQLRVQAQLRCMCGRDLGIVHGFVKCECGMSYRLGLDTWPLGNGWFTGTLHVVDDVRENTVRYMTLASAAHAAEETFKSLFQSNGISRRGITRKQLVATRATADAAHRAVHEFVRALDKQAAT